MHKTFSYFRGCRSPLAQASLIARRTGSRPGGRSGRWAAALVLLISIALALSQWYPGDETLRTLSESPLKLMISRTGFSLGPLRFGPRQSAPQDRPGKVWKGPLPRWVRALPRRPSSLPRHPSTLPALLPALLTWIARAARGARKRR